MERVAAASEGESLAAFLCDQLERLRLPKPMLALCRYIAQLVNEDGHLLQEDLDSVSELGVPLLMTSQALDILQSLEPAGVAARSLSECLLLQLKRMKEVPAGATEIAERFLSEISRGQYRRIAEALALPVETVRTAAETIAGLEACPGRDFQRQEAATYIRPDVFVVELDGELRAIVNEFYLPQVTISDYYVRLLRSSDGQADHEYLRQKLQQAKGLLVGLERRAATLHTCAEMILEVQHDFFSGTSSKLVPLNLTALSRRISVHPSTVSRAVRDKYLQCRQGIFPLRYFFSRAVGDNGVSQQEIRQMLLELVRSEDKAAPLSDRQLQKTLEVNGIRLARRTVAKYRNKLGIPPVEERRRGS